MLDIIKHDLSPMAEKITIYPINDLHVGEKSFDKRMFLAFVQMIANTPDAYVVLVGDLLNNAIITSVSNVYEEEMSPSEQKNG